MGRLLVVATVTFAPGEAVDGAFILFFVFLAPRVIFRTIMGHADALLGKAPAWR